MQSDGEGGSEPAQDSVSESITDAETVSVSSTKDDK